MVLQVCAHAGQIHFRGDAVLLQQSAWANARELQELRRANRPSGEHHRLCGVGCDHFVAVPHFNACTTLLTIGQGFHEQLGHLC